MADQDIAILVPVAIVWTLIFSFIIILFAGWTIQSIHPVIAISAGAVCAVVWLRFRDVI